MKGGTHTQERTARGLVFAWLPKPLLFRNHDCVNMKPGHINCSCFGVVVVGETVFSRLSFLCSGIEAELSDLTRAKLVASRLWPDTTLTSRDAVYKRRRCPGCPWSTTLPTLRPRLFLAAVLFIHSGAGSCFYVTTSAKSLIVFF